MLRVAIGPITWSVQASAMERAGENPGVGGTSHVAVLVALRLAQLDMMQVTLVFRGAEPRFTYPVSVSVIPEAQAIHKDAFDIWVVPVASMNPSELHQLSMIQDARVVLWSHHPHDQRLRELLRQIEPAALVSLGDYQFMSNSWVGIPHHRIPNPFPHWIDDTNLLPYEKRPMVAGVVGALDPAKGFHRLAKQWSGIRKVAPSLELEVLGSNSLYTGMEPAGLQIPTSRKYEAKILRSFGSEAVPDSVHFRGVVANKGAYIRRWRAAFLNLTGKSEAQPTSLIECLALGVPPITAADYGMWDVMNQFPELAVRKPAECIEKAQLLVASPDFGREMVERALTMAAQARFEDSKLEERWANLFSQVLPIDGPIAPVANSGVTHALPRPLRRRITARNAVWPLRALRRHVRSHSLGWPGAAR